MSWVVSMDQCIAGRKRLIKVRNEKNLEEKVSSKSTLKWYTLAWYRG